MDTGEHDPLGTISNDDSSNSSATDSENLKSSNMSKNVQNKPSEALKILSVSDIKKIATENSLSHEESQSPLDMLSKLSEDPLSSSATQSVVSDHSPWTENEDSGKEDDVDPSDHTKLSEENPEIAYSKELKSKIHNLKSLLDNISETKGDLSESDSSEENDEETTDKSIKSETGNENSITLNNTELLTPKTGKNSSNVKKNYY